MFEIAKLMLTVALDLATIFWVKPGIKEEKDHFGLQKQCCHLKAMKYSLRSTCGKWHSKKFFNFNDIIFKPVRCGIFRILVKGLIYDQTTEGQTFVVYFNQRWSKSAFSQFHTFHTFSQSFDAKMAKIRQN